jgi:hypothetical protein
LDIATEKYKLPEIKDYHTLSNIDKTSIELQYLIDEVCMRRETMIDLYTQQKIPLPNSSKHINAAIDATFDATFDSAYNATIYDDELAGSMIRELLGLTFDLQTNLGTSSDQGIGNFM